jgi:hypothetical protein
MKSPLCRENNIARRFSTPGDVHCSIRPVDRDQCASTVGSAAVISMAGSVCAGSALPLRAGPLVVEPTGCQELDTTGAGTGAIAAVG